ncbi:hypothetical protein CRG98_045513 [Punica granatum]|nr:hypothetical protein CRG98_045513 [Punica granatum]
MAEECQIPQAKPLECQVPQAKPPEECCAPQANQSSPTVKDNAPVREVWHLCKNQLQMYAQKRNLPLPTYSCEREGPPHASRFKCKVTVDGQTFESSDFCSTLKDAEHAAAQVALLALSANIDQEGDSGLYKNLLQEFAQREGYHLPAYETNGSGGHVPIFTSTVVIAGESFTGQQERTKKQAEMSAAKVAYTILKKRKRSHTSNSPSPAHQRPRSFSSSSSQPNSTPGIPLSIGPKVGAASNFTLLTERDYGSGEDTRRKNHNHPVPYGEAKTSILRSEDPSSDSIYARLRSPILEENSSESSSPSEDDNLLTVMDLTIGSSTEAINDNELTVREVPIESSAEAINDNVLTVTDLTIESTAEAISVPPPGVIRIYSRASNVTLPEGTIVAHSDENWIAVTAGGDRNLL